MSFEESAAVIISGFKSDPRNKVFVDFPTLLAAAREETGNSVEEADLIAAIDAYISGECSEEQESIYDGAVYACGYVARHCFGDDPDDDVDYDVEWIAEDSGGYTAQVMPG